MANLNLSLSLDNTRNIESLLIGLEDERVRKGLMSQPQVPSNVRQLVGMIEDKRFLDMASEIVTEMGKIKKQNISRADSAIKNFSTLGAAPPAEPTISDVRSKGVDLKQYIESNYPEAVDLLKKYGEVSFARMPNVEYGYFSSNLDVAANAEAVVNAGVYTNVAVATMAVVAAAVVAVVGAVVV